MQVVEIHILCELLEIYVVTVYSKKWGYEITFLQNTRQPIKDIGCHCVLQKIKLRLFLF